MFTGASLFHAIFDSEFDQSLSEEADPSGPIASSEPGQTLTGDDGPNEFSVGHSATTVQAGGGNDTIWVGAPWWEEGEPPGDIDGGDGYDTLTFGDGGSVVVNVDAGTIDYQVVALGGQVLAFGQWNVRNVEFFRGTSRDDLFWGGGEGARFEGGRGNDQFFLFDAPFSDTVDYEGETGERGIILNFSSRTVEHADLLWLHQTLREQLTPLLAEDVMIPGGFATDTFGDLDLYSGSFVIEGSKNDDFFIGSSGDDRFHGKSGNDHFYGDLGTNHIYGDAGEDTLYLSGNRDQYQVSFADGTFTIKTSDDSEIHIVRDVERFFFGNTLHTAESLKNAGNTPPVAGADTYTTKEDTKLTIAVSSLLSNDHDNEGAVTLVSVQDPVNGTVALASGKVVFTPASDFHGAAGFTYTIKDTDGSTVTQHVTVSVTSVNDAPNGAGSTVRLDEDTAYRFKEADFGYTDLEGDALKEVIIVSLPTSGTLKLGTKSVTVGQAIKASELGQLNWTPSLNAFGDGLASFTFKVRDAGGTANGGIDTDPTAGRITFNVTPVNDAPTLTLSGAAQTGTVSLAEGTDVVTKVTASDVDGTVKISLKGADAADFKISASNELTFVSRPDFEAPRDADKNNVYKVTVVATDAGGLAVSKDLTITVKNVAGNVVTGNSSGNLLDATHRISGGKYATGEEDRIDGKGGDDTIKAGDGNDTLIGGLGKDFLTGGNGADQFRFDTTPASNNVDTITDYRHGQDRIALDDRIFKAIGPSLSSNEFYAAKGATAAHDSSDRIIYDTRTGRLYYDDDGNKPGGHAAILIATLSGHPTIDVGDFLIV